MKYYEVSASIDAPPERVWAVLTDAEAWPSWDSGIEKIEGSVSLGSKIKLYSEASPGRAFPLKVTELSSPSRMVFSGGMPLGLFKGVRTYTLSDSGGGTDFHMREEYSGPLLGMIWRSMPDLQPSFDKFAEGLKKRVETNG